MLNVKNQNHTPHVFRHSTAMSLLQAEVDFSIIAIWLGHKNIETTHKNMVADINLKKNALNKLYARTGNNNISEKYKPNSVFFIFKTTVKLCAFNLFKHLPI